MPEPGSPALRGEEVLDLRALALFQAGLHAFLGPPVQAGDPLVLSKMLGPRVDQEHLDVAIRIGRVDVQLPEVGAIALAATTQL